MSCLDIGCWYKELCTDMAMTVIAGEVDEKKRARKGYKREALVRGSLS